MNSRLNALYENVGLEEEEQPLKDQSMSLFITDEEDHKLFRLFVDRFEVEGTIIHDVTHRMMVAGPYDRIEVRISSGGGVIREGIRLWNAMRDVFGDRITTVVESNAYSMGAMLFCQGNTRVIYPDSDLMFHDYSTMMMGKGGEILDQTLHTRRMFDRLFKPILENNWVTEEEYDRMVDGKEMWMECDEMLQRGIATHIRINGQLVTAADYLNR